MDGKFAMLGGVDRVVQPFQTETVPARLVLSSLLPPQIQVPFLSFRPLDCFVALVPPLDCVVALFRPLVFFVVLVFPRCCRREGTVHLPFRRSHGKDVFPWLCRLDFLVVGFFHCFGP